ncbi:marC integral membrane family protein [Chlamydia avium]|uniref:UPF0056 membrane protein n=1 Tax=Chlamydia avium TaxID=1457141 RepID=A0ABN0MRG1_9CHLA|nr:marC integral membrane family protein [Chlamydia avium]
MVTLLLFITFGRKIFHFFNISLYAFQFIGGVLLFSVSLKMALAPPIIPTDQTTSETEDTSEPVFFPLAFPVTTGPAVITSLLGYMEEHLFPKEIILGAVFISWALSVFTLLSSSFVNRVLGSSGLVALERLFSITLLLMSVNLILKGISIAFNIGFYIK